MAKVGQYIRNNSQFAYSIILIFLIPILIIANTLWQIRLSRDTMSLELQKKAELAQTMLQESVNDPLNAELVQTKLDKITESNSEVKEITVLKQTTDGFVAIASTNNDELGLKYSSEDYINAWAGDKSFSEIAKDTSKTPNERYHMMTSILKDSVTGKKLAILSLKISNADIDASNKKNLDYSLIILAITIFLVLLLLINQFRFFQYAVLYRKLAEVDRMKDDFISVASHEMKTPMAAIKGYLSMLLEGLAGKYDKKTQEHLLKIMASVQRLDILVIELLDVSRLEQGRMKFDLQPCNISDLVKQSISSFQDQAAAKDLKLMEKIPAKLPQVFIDPERLRQVTDNLIGNAVKYTEKGGIEVSYRVEDGCLLTIVKDSGIGMSEGDRKNLFSKFYRIKNEKTADIPGTGLGLWLAREIVRKMDGDIIVNSQVGVGSEFVIKLPFMKEK